MLEGNESKPRNKRKVQYADEAVVVLNLKPVKASNGVEDKTKGTSFIVMMTVVVQKTRADVKGGRDFKEYQEV